MFRVEVEDEEDQRYVDSGLETFLAIDKAGAGILDKMTSNSKKLLRNIAKKHNLDYYVLREGKDEFVRGRGDAVGLIDFQTFEGGHWNSFYYIRSEDRFILYDSRFDLYTLDCDEGQYYLLQFSDYVDYTGNSCNSDHPLVERAREIRPGYNARQPATEWDTSHASQHQFCLAESLMFLEELLGDIPVSVCRNTRDSLVTAKRYVGKCADILKFPVHPEFFFVYDDDGGGPSPV